MELIGSGWQFDVYAKGTTVEKRPVPTVTMARRVLRSYPHLALRPWALVSKVRKVQRDRDTILDELDSRDLNRALLADFRRDGGRLLQTRVFTLENALCNKKLNARWVLDRYVQSICDGWKHGIAETSFNFTVNHGLDRYGRAVIIDVGELTFDKAEVRRLVQTRFWEKSFSIGILAPGLREYLLRSLARTVTVERLEREWRDAPYRPLTQTAPDRSAVRRTRHTLTPQPSVAHA